MAGVEGTQAEDQGNTAFDGSVMPGVKGKSGRTAICLDTYYAREKAWKEFESKNPRPAFLPRESTLTLNFKALAKQLKAEKFNHDAGQDRAQHNVLRAKKAKGMGRVLHAVEGDWQAAKRLAIKILEWHQQGKSKTHIANLARKHAGNAVSPKAISKLLVDFADNKEGLEQ
jgi:hypothetical protein